MIKNATRGATPITALLCVIICSAAPGQVSQPKPTFGGGFLEVIGDGINFQPLFPDLNINSLLHLRPIGPLDSFSFIVDTTDMIDRDTGAFRLDEDVYITGNRLLPRTFRDCTIKPRELWLPCFIGEANEIPIDPGFFNIPLVSSSAFDPTTQQITGTFILPVSGDAWTFQANGLFEGKIFSTNFHYVLSDLEPIPEPHFSLWWPFVWLCLNYRKLVRLRRGND